MSRQRWKPRTGRSTHGMNSCFKNVAHSDFELALAEAKRQNKRVWKCRQCGLYHLGPIRRGDWSKA